MTARPSTQEAEKYSPEVKRRALVCRPGLLREHRVERACYRALPGKPSLPGERARSARSTSLNRF